MTVKQLREQGYRIQIRHIRKYKPEKGYMHPKTTIDPKGGRTEVWITSPAGEDGRGFADCADKDSYVRKMGVTIALGRALKDLRKKCTTK